MGQKDGGEVEGPKETFFCVFCVFFVFLLFFWTSSILHSFSSFASMQETPRT
tara:strand:- start:42 stop:197 length:156 start_codon:yes stop_codon:yes gene_type:complete